MPPSSPLHARVRTQSDLQTMWRTLMDPDSQGLGFGGHSLWLVLIDSEDRPCPQVTELTEAVDPPDDEMVDSLARFLEHFADDGLRFAFLRSRPGHGGLTDDDRAWARALYDTARRAGVPVEVVHRACDQDLVPVPMDEVA